MSRGQPAMAGLRVVVLAIGLIVLVLGLGSLLVVNVSGPTLGEEIQRSFVVPSGQRIEVQGRNGSIDYAPWDGKEVVIRATKRAGGLFPWLTERLARAVEVEISQSSRGVSAVQRGPLGMFLGNVSVQYQVQVPRGWSGEVALRTSNGSVRAEGLHGNADLRSSNGAILVEDQSGSVRARTSNGRVELAGVNGVVDAESSNGAIRIDGGELTGAGGVRTSNGAIHIHAKLEPGASYEARTSNGRVTLVLADPSVSLDLRTSNGTIDLETDVIVSELGRSSLEGRIGDGASKLVARTSNGDITLSKALAADGGV